MELQRSRYFSQRSRREEEKGHNSVSAPPPTLTLTLTHTHAHHHHQHPLILAHSDNVLSRNSKETSTHFENIVKQLIDGEKLQRCWTGIICRTANVACDLVSSAVFKAPENPIDIRHYVQVCLIPPLSTNKHKLIFVLMMVF